MPKGREGGAVERRQDWESGLGINSAEDCRHDLLAPQFSHVRNERFGLALGSWILVSISQRNNDHFHFPRPMGKFCLIHCALERLTLGPRTRIQQTRNNSTLGG